MQLDEKAYTIITQEGFDHFPNDQFQNFEQYAAHFNPQQTFPGPPGPPTPPNQHPAALGGQQQQQQAQTLNGGAAAANMKAIPADVLAMTKAEPNDDLRGGRQGSNSDEDELTPAQSRRKAQNRAAYVVPHLRCACTLRYNCLYPPSPT